MDVVKNFAKVVVSVGYAAGVTSITLSTGHGAKLPDPAADGAFNLVWWNVTDYPDPTDDITTEIVRCTARVGDVLTVIRAQENTADADHNTATKTYQMILSLTKKMIDDISSEMIRNIVEDTTPQLGGNLDLRTHKIVGEGGSEGIYVDSGGNVGVGTTNPSQQLKLTGNFEISDTTHADGSGIIYKGGDTFIHNFNYGNNGTVTTEGGNVFIGKNAGNFTMGSTATQAYHASYNFAIGYSALSSNTIGHSNSAIGGSVLRSNTTGSHNSAIGTSALRSNTTGYANFAIGYSALYSNTTGHSNSAIGTNAGRYIADGSTGNTTGDYNIFLGYNTKALADNDQNEIVIGYNATGVGSNSVVLGNDSVIKTVLKGDVGFGTSSPTEKLDINSDAIRVRTAQTPASAGAAGNQGDICWDADYIYICVATNTWKRSAIATW